MHAHTASSAAHLPRWAVAAIAVVAFTVGCIILASVDRRAIGLFHDDGLYAVVARAMAQGQGHRIISLPDAPFQTKYPPLYTAVLSVVWWLYPEFPANVFWLKALNVLFVLAALVGIAVWAKGTLQPLTAVLLVTVVGTSPGVIGFSDYPMSDIAFLCAFIWYTSLWSRGKSATSRSRHGGIVFVSAVAVLVRSVGVVFMPASAVECLRAGRWRWLALHVAVPLAAFLAWSGWAAWHQERDAGELLSYYIQYETSALGYFWSRPTLARDIILGNLALTIVTFHHPLGQAWRLWAPAYLLLAAIGAWRLIQEGQRLPLILAAVYVSVIVIHPFAPHRYLLPLVPVVVFLVLAGAERIARTASRSPQVINTVSAIVVTATAASLVAPNVHPIVARIAPAHDRVRGWYGFDMGYTWRGFEECFEWIRRSTPAEARLATMFDGAYFLHTDRQAIRPWVHYSATYFYPVGQAEPFVGEAAVVLAELQRLGISYVILDPAAGFTEGQAATKMLRELLALPDARSSLVFTSTDGMHEIYRLGGNDVAQHAVPFVSRSDK